MAVLDVILGVVLRVLQTTWRFVLSNFYGSKRNQLPPITDKILLQSATSLAAQIRSRKLKSEDVVQAFITRIQQVDKFINAVVDDRFADAIEDAKKVDAYLQTSNLTEKELLAEKPFLGVPITTKNAIGIKGLVMDSGVAWNKGYKPDEDSDAIALMRTAGAIPLCVTNVPEFCMWYDSSNTLYGRTNNPYDLTRIPGGSSGGESALIGAAGSVIGIGNDIAGSIRIPSFCCGIFGHKPTRKIISNLGQFPPTDPETEVDNYVFTGPMCRYSEDLLPMFKILAAEHLQKWKMNAEVDLKRLKVYYMEDYIDDNYTSPVSDEMKDAVTKVVAHLEKSCGMTVQKVKFPEMRDGLNMWLNKLSTEDGILHFDQQVSQRKVSPLMEFLKCIFGLSKHTINSIYVMAVIKYSSVTQNPDSELRKGLHKDFDKLQRDISTTLGDDGVWILPPNVEPAIYHQETIIKFRNIVYTNLFNILGLPVTQCPTGLSKDGIPLGVQVIGNYHKDHLTIAVATEIEKAFGGWKTPSPIA